jgi:hypothetical protein
MCLFRIMCRVAMLSSLCLLIGAGSSRAADDQDVRFNLHLPLLIECSAYPYDSRVANADHSGIYISDEPMIFHVTTNALIGEFGFNYLSSSGNLRKEGTGIQTWYLFREAGGPRPASNDPHWMTGSALNDAAPLMFVIGERDFEIWCKVRVLEQPPGMYTCSWEIELNMLVTTCTQEAVFSCYVVREGDIPDEYEIKEEGTVAGGTR